MIVHKVTSIYVSYALKAYFYYIHMYIIWSFFFLAIFTFTYLCFVIVKRCIWSLVEGMQEKIDASHIHIWTHANVTSKNK